MAVYRVEQFIKSHMQREIALPIDLFTDNLSVYSSNN